MSIIPYNNFTVRDLSNVEQPYVNSTREVGFFSGGNLGAVGTNRWLSLLTYLNTNNGIARVSADGGLTILNSGIYKINLSLFPTSSQDGSSNILFNFGTRRIRNEGPTLTSYINAFGGVCPTGMFTYDPSNNPYIPGIISWVAEGYSSGNSRISNFVTNSTTNELSYNYSIDCSAGQIYSGISTTEMTCIIAPSATIYFNVSTNSTSSATLGNCCFTLEFISTISIPIPTWKWSFTNNAPITAAWSAITSSIDGANLAATVNGGTIYTSSDSGVSWTARTDGVNPSNGLPATANWVSIASSGDGAKLAAIAATPNGGVWTSSNSGSTWTQGTLTGTNSWTGISSSRDGNYLAAIASNIIGIYIWTTSTNTWTLKTTGLPTLVTNWSSITSSANGQYLAASIDSTVAPGGIYRSSNYGDNWSAFAGNFRWSYITSSSLGQYLAAPIFNGQILTSLDYGVSWTARASISTTWKCIESSSDGTKLAAVSNGAGTGTMYTSSNSGISWTKQTNNLPATANWSCITSSGYGTKLAAAVSGGRIYTGVYS
jgi:hypothetical protein